MASLGMTEADRAAIQQFEADVITPSMTQLIVLQFTAEWCGPCKQLAPVMEKVMADYADKGVRLVKIDVDKERMIAAQFRIQSVPTIYAFFRGQPVADLTNYRSEGQLKQALDQLLGQLPVEGDAQDRAAEIAPMIELGETALDDGDSQRAKILFSQLIEIEPENPRIVGGLLRAMIALGESDAARAMLDGLEEKLKSDPALSRAAAMLEISSSGADAIDTSAFEARIAANADDHEARFELAQALMANGNRDGAADQLLEIIGRDRDWNEGAARAKFLSLLEASGLADPWSSAQRRRLSAVLFT